jgi:hypothetical protein
MSKGAWAVTLIVIGLLGTAFLAIEAGASGSGVYEVTAAKVKAVGQLNECNAKNCTRFGVSVERAGSGRNAGKLSGHLSLRVATTNTNYSFPKITLLSCAGTSAAFHATSGHASGSANRHKVFEADTSVSGSGHSGTFLTVVRDSATQAIVYLNGGPITGKNPVVKIEC